MDIIGIKHLINHRKNASTTTQINNNYKVLTYRSQGLSNRNTGRTSLGGSERWSRVLSIEEAPFPPFSPFSMTYSSPWRSWLSSSFSSELSAGFHEVKMLMAPLCSYVIQSSILYTDFNPHGLLFCMYPGIFNLTLTSLGTVRV